jgi:hypothetical protein
MKQVLRRTGAGVAVLFGISLTSLGCTDEETGFYIVGNIVIDPPDCVASADASGVMLARGSLDVALTPEYVASWVVASQLTPRGDKTNLRTETMVANLSGVEVRLSGGAETLEYTVPASGTIVPDGSEAPGVGVAIATLIPAAVGVELANELTDRGQRITRVAEVRVFGKTIGGLDFETSPFNYEVRVCEGCRISYPPDTLVANSMTGEITCSGALTDAPEPGCLPGQDEPVDCRFCSGFNPYCRSPDGG